MMIIPIMADQIGVSIAIGVAIIILLLFAWFKMERYFPKKSVKRQGHLQDISFAMEKSPNTPQYSLSTKSPEVIMGSLTATPESTRYSV